MSSASSGEHRAPAAAALVGDGLTHGDIAAAFDVQPDTARRMVKQGRELHRPGRDFAPHLEQVGTEPQPAALTLAQSWARPEQSATRLALHELRIGVREHV